RVLDAEAYHDGFDLEPEMRERVRDAFPCIVALRLEPFALEDHVEGRQRLWYKGGDGREIGLAAPVKRLLPKVSPVEALL
ncbi:MAG: hypothetical protein P8Y95_18040, partial [Gammaproteobacteria bacterium]